MKRNLKILMFVLLLFLLTGCGKETYVVTFDLNGGVLINGELSQEVKEGDDAIAPISTREGYTFNGWNLDFNNVANDVTVKANWIINQYTITLMDDGNVISTLEFDYQEDIAGINSLTKEGYSFAWNQTIPEKMPSEDLTITAVWTALESNYRVEYYLEELDGTFTLMESENHLALTDSIVEGTIKEYTGFSLDLNNPLNALNGVVKGDGSLILKLHYTRNVYTVTFKDYDGTVLKTQEVLYHGSATAPNTPDHEEYLFKNWDANFDSIESNLVVNAIYDDAITVNYYINGDIYDSEKIVSNSQIPDIWGYEDYYVFDGWYIDSEKTTLWDFNVVSDTNLNLYGIAASKLHYVLDDSNQVTIVGAAPLPEDGVLTIPSKLYHWDVVRVGANAFFEQTSLQHVTIENGITDIDFSAFALCSSLESIDLPDSLTTIGDSAFIGCSSLTGISIPENVSTIGEKAFYECSKLAEFNVSDENENYQALDGNLLSKDGTNFIQFAIGSYVSSYQIPNGVSTIFDFSFYKANNLHSITLPNGVLTIGVSAFDNCINLSSVILPDSLNQIGEKAFNGCSSLTEIILPEGVTSIEDSTFAYCIDLDSVILSTVTNTIGENVFNHCINLTSINIPDSIESIGSFAFYYCQSLTSIHIPNSLTEINHQAFAYCASLTTINIPSNIVSLDYSSFENCINLAEISISESVTYIGKNSFYGTKWEKNHEDGVIYINNVLYKYKGTMPSNTSIVVREGTISISDSAFYNLFNLKRIVIPGSVERMGNRAFQFCPLVSIKVAKNVQPIGWDAEWNYDSRPVEWNYPVYKTVTFDGNGGTLVSGETLQSVYEGTSAIAPVFEKTGYDFMGWDQSIDNITDNITVYAVWQIHTYTVTFQDYDGTILKTEGVEYLSPATPPLNPTRDDFQFIEWDNDFSSITSDLIISPIYKQFFTVSYYVNDYLYDTRDYLEGSYIDDVWIDEEIGTFTPWTKEDHYVWLFDQYQLTGDLTLIASVFYDIPFEVVNDQIVIIGFANIATVNIPNTIMKRPVVGIGDNAFHDKTNLTTITFGGEITFIGNNAFEGCSNLNNIILPDSVVTIGNRAFKGCSSLSDLTLPNVTAIGDEAFNGCSNLSNVTLGDSLTRIGYRSYEGCSSLTNITLPTSLTSIDHFAFKSSGLTSITIPQSVTYIGRLVFEYCNDIQIYCEVNYHLDGYDMQWNFDYDGTPFDITWNYIFYNVTFDGNGGTLVSGDASQEVLYETSATSPIFEKTGYDFVGWDQDFSSITGDLTVVAIWEIHNYTVTFKDYDGTVLKTEEVAYQSSATPPAAPDNKEGYMFSHWDQDYSSIVSDLEVLAIYEVPLTVNYYVHDELYDTKKVVPNSLIADVWDHDSYYLLYGWFDSSFSFQWNFEENRVTEDLNLYASVESFFDFTITMDEVTILSMNFFPDDNIITIPNTIFGKSVVAIGSNAFSGLSFITSITIPSSVTSMGDFAFSDCSSLTTIDIPESVTSMGDGVFAGCTSLSSINVNSNNPVYQTIEGNVYSKDGTSLIFGVTSTIILPMGVTSIAAFACANNSQVSEIQRTFTIQSIGTFAFASTNITYFFTFDGLKSIGSFAFAGAKLTSFDIPKTVTTVGACAFMGNSIGYIFVSATNTYGWDKNWNWNGIDYIDVMWT